MKRSWVEHEMAQQAKLPHLMNTGQSLKPTWWKKRSDSCKFSSTHSSMCTHIHAHTRNKYMIV